MGSRNYQGVIAPKHPWVADQMRGVVLSAPVAVRQMMVHRNGEAPKRLGEVTLVAAPGDVLRFVGRNHTGTVIWDRTYRVPPRDGKQGPFPEFIRMEEA